MKTEYFKNTSNAFNYSFERVLKPAETVLLKMPPVSANKRGINDIGFAAEEGVSLFATLSSRPEREGVTLWQEIRPFDTINKTTAYIRIENTSQVEAKKVNIRVILN